MVQQLNNYNSTNDSLLNTQTGLRDPHIEPSIGGQVGANQGGEKGEELKGATDIAQTARAHCGGLSPEMGGVRLWMALPSAARSKEI